MFQELATYGGWACAIVAGFVAASNYAALRTERAQADNLYRRLVVAREALRSIYGRATPKAKGAERDMRHMALDAFKAQSDIANQETAGGE